MWFGWSMATWESIFLWATICAAGFGGLSLSSAFISAIVGYEISDRVTQEANEKISKANNRTAQLEKEAASLEADNLSLQTSLRPRRLSFVGWTENAEKVSAITDALKKFAGTIAFIQSVPDFESQMFARDISSVLEQAGWKPQFVNESKSHLPENNFPEGVTLFTLSDGKTQTQAGTAFWSALTEADVLMSGTGTFGAYIPHEILSERKLGYPYFTPPVTAILIRVGIKPFTSQFLEIQRRNMERIDRKFDSKLRELYELSGSMQMGVPNHAPISVKPGPDGGWIAVNPTEQSLIPKLYWQRMERLY